MEMGFGYLNQCVQGAWEGVLWKMINPYVLTKVKVCIRISVQIVSSVTYSSLRCSALS